MRFGLRSWAGWPAACLLALVSLLGLCLTNASAIGLEVLPNNVEMNFPGGYRVMSDEGKVMKTVPGPASATVKAKSSGKVFAPGEVYLSDWSYERLQKGEKPNWIVPNTAVPAAAPTKNAASTPKGIVAYPSVREVSFPEGYSVFTDDGQLIKTVPGPTSIALMAESDGKSFAGGKAYLSDWSFEQLQQGKSPNWVVGHGPRRAPELQDSDNYAEPLISLPRPFLLETTRETFDDCDIVDFNGRVIASVPLGSPINVVVRGVSSGLHLPESEFHKMLAGLQPHWIRPAYLRDTSNSIAPKSDPSFGKPANVGEPKISDFINVSLSASTASSNVGGAKSLDEKQRGMKARGSISNHNKPGEADVAVYPDAVEVVFPDGYYVFNDYCTLVADIPGPVKATVRARAKDTAGVPLKPPPYGQITTLTPDEARSLIFYRNLNLNGLTVLSPETAEALLEASQMPGCAGDPRLRVELNGLAQLTEESAHALSQIKCDTLSLNGLKNLGLQVATNLSQSKSKSLCLNGLLSLNVTEAAALSQYIGGSGTAIQLNGLQSLSESAALALNLARSGSFSSIEINGLQSVSDALARALSQSSTENLQLNGVLSISDNAAMTLGSFRGSLELNGLKTLSTKAAVCLAGSTNGTHESLRRLCLNGVSQMPVSALNALTGYRGTVELNGFNDQHARNVEVSEASSESDRFYLCDTDYERMKNGAAPNWILVPYSIQSPKVAALFYKTLERQVNYALPQLKGASSDDLWSEVDDAYGSRNIVEHIIFAHHPLTSKTYVDIAKGYGGKTWDNVFEIDGFSESLEVASGTWISVEEAPFEGIASLPRNERNWFLSTLPGVYQAVVDAFRRDLEPQQQMPIKPEPERLPTIPNESVYLEFYRSPFIPTGLHKKYALWNKLSQEEKALLAKGLSSSKPSFYGVRIYRGSKCVEDIALFGAVDFELFVEIMMRNFTKRKAGLSLDSTDEWLQGFCDTIYKKIFERLHHHLFGVEKIFWKASGYMSLVPLDLIAIQGGGSDCIAEIPMIEVSAAEALGKLGLRGTELNGSDVLLVGNPDFNMGQTQSVTQHAYDANAMKVVSRAFSGRSLAFDDLPGADTEVTKLLGILTTTRPGQVKVLRGPDATKTEVLERLRCSRVAHLATHGFYLDMTLSPEEGDSKLFDEMKKSSDLFFRSGLALAGANATLTYWSKDSSSAAPDGILLASEIKQLDLNNIKLLVLSACSTAEGKPVDGRSVASLREAFLSAGVETLVSTLWDIPDDFTVKIMGDFYQSVMQGDSPSVALWKAKRKNFLELRKSNGFAESMVKVAPFVAVTQAAKDP